MSIFKLENKLILFKTVLRGWMQFSHN